jgi:alpha/beta hydrolase family protein
VISIQTLSDFYRLNGFYRRRPDSTGPAGNYRLYDVAGAGHVSSTQVAYTPSGDELVRAGFPANWWDSYCDGELTTFPLEYAIDAAFANLFRWARDGVPVPIANRIDVTDPTSPPASPLTDPDGNVIGGPRTPTVDVPVATYFGTTAGTGTCQFLSGSQVPLTKARIDKL